MNKTTKILIFFLFLGLILIFLLYLKFNIPCIFKTIFSIPCPACGMTRAFKLILHFKIFKSFSFNVLAFPTLIIFTTTFIIYVIDIILNTDYLNKFINVITKNYYILITVLIISWIINIYRNI